MGGKSFFCPIFSFSRKSRRYNVDDEAASDSPEQPARLRNKVRSSDEDYGRWVGERDVDQKATDFIARFHQRSLVV